jgi:DNA-binding Lrp family transcriptional regulator
MIAPQIDELDRQLIEILGHDARVSNRKIANDLGVTEGTVRGRIKRLQQDRLISFTAVTDVGLSGGAKLAFIGVQTDLHQVHDVARQIGELPQVNALMITMGRFNILAMCLFDDLAAVVEIASDQILSIEGVHHVETTIAVKTVKYNPRIVRITEVDQSE